MTKEIKEQTRILKQKDSKNGTAKTTSTLTARARVEQWIAEGKREGLVPSSWKELLPIADWLPRYNVKSWLLGDLLSGLTVGFLVIPQALAYAKLAGVPLQFGLYTSLVGVLIYPLLATCKDLTIGPTSVLSTLTGQLLASSNPTNLSPVIFTAALALFAGTIQASLGLLRLGAIVDLISVPVVVGFTTGAALQIIIGQLAGLFGIPNINTNDPPYLVLYNTLRNLGHARLDASFGFASLFTLISFRVVTGYLVNKKGLKWSLWLGHASNAITLIIFTLISFLSFRGERSNPSSFPVKLVGDIPTGLTYFHTPTTSQFGQMWGPAFSVVLVGIIEHIALTKAFGRLNGYRADPNQEVIALGVNNILSSFLGAFPSTGSLSRSSINARSGVKSPLAGWVTAIIVILSIFFVTPAFYYIPSAVLSSIIIVSVSDLLSRPSVIIGLWNVNITDFLSFFVAFWVTIFVSIEVAIYSSVGFSILVLLYRIARPKVQVLVREETVGGGWINYPRDGTSDGFDSTPFPGIVVFRIEEALTYPNSNHLTENIKTWIQGNTRYGGGEGQEFLWNERRPVEKSIHSQGGEDNIFELNNSNNSQTKPTLKAIVFDFSGVNHLDATGLQTLLDIQADAQTWAGHESRKVLIYFANVNPNPNVSNVLEIFLKGQRSEVEKSRVEGDVERGGGTPESSVDSIVPETLGSPLPASTSNGGLYTFANIDDAVDAAARPFNFGRFSTSTIV